MGKFESILIKVDCFTLDGTQRGVFFQEKIPTQSVAIKSKTTL